MLIALPHFAAKNTKRLVITIPKISIKIHCTPENKAHQQIIAQNERYFKSGLLGIVSDTPMKYDISMSPNIIGITVEILSDSHYGGSQK
jgi:hypothetical protein